MAGLRGLTLLRARIAVLATGHASQAGKPASVRCSQLVSSQRIHSDARRLAHRLVLSGRISPTLRAPS